MDCLDIQGCCCLSISIVSIPCPHGQHKHADNWNRIIAIVLAFFCFLVLATFPGWHEDVEGDMRPLPSRPVSQASLALIFMASVFVLVSVLWQHTASVAASTIAKDIGNGSVKSGVGTTAMILGWFGFALLVIVTVGLLMMILSIRMITQLTDEEE